MSNDQIRQSQENYFRELFIKHKDKTMAVSSESWAHKRLRYEMLTDIIEDLDNFTIHDVGMGLADLFSFMKVKYANRSFNYSGTEILNDYLIEARRKYPELKFYNRDLVETVPEEKYDWVVLSGVFHQRRDAAIKDWERFMQKLLTNSFIAAEKGLAFNVISPFVDFYQENLYYCNISKLLNFISDDLSRFFTIKHNYALYEMTVFVYKETFIKQKHTEQELQKYFKQ